ncbi:retrovirus-related Pol polyprotein from transposon 297 [Trichonephila clavipes]|nr:retrovirus-related Pol polyprotein from transposon 297 [Trichonephila clavipes]
MDPNSTKYTSFVTHEGQYEFLRVPFGLSNSPSVFQRFIYTAFRKLIRDNILIVYMDDLLIPSQDEAEGLNKLRLVLQTAADFGLELNLKKCNFLQRKIEFLGYIIENGTIKPSPSKTQTASHASYPHVKLVNKKAFSIRFQKEESIEYVPITTGVPRGNGQMERMHETIIPVLTKLTIEEPEKWFKHVHRLQRIMNSTTTRSTKFTPFEVLIGVKMKQKEDLQIKHLLEDELSEQFINKRETLCNEAKENILRLQAENKKQYNKHRKPAYNYKPVYLFPERRGRRGHQDARVDISYLQTTSEAMIELK